MIVHVYTPAYNYQLSEVLRSFAAGIPGAVVLDQADYQPSDVAVIFGVVKKSYERTWSKQKILDAHSGRSLIIVESAFVLRKLYYQIGFGGFAGHADFRNADAPPDRWNKISIRDRPWKKDARGVTVVCGQLPHDTTVQDLDHVGWCQKTVRYCQRQGFETWFRPHPRIKDPALYGIDFAPHDTRDLHQTFAKARCMVTWNSTTAVEAAIHGVPVIALDPGSFAWPVANHSLDAVHGLTFPDRSRWLAGLGYAQWTLPEMRDGLPWRHLTRE